jgi:ABC-type multidrug transport system fused ATPase/permease subunit
VAVLMPVTAVAEMAMVAAIVPFLAVLAGQPAHEALPLLALFLDGLERLAPANPLLAATTLFALAALATGMLRLTLAWTSQNCAFGLGHELSVEIQRRLFYQSYLYHLQHHSSELLSLLDKVDHLVFNLVPQAFQAISATLIALFVIAVLVSLDPLIAALAALLVGGLYAMTLLVARRRLSARAKVIGPAYQQRLKSVQDSLGGIRDIILDRSQDLHLERFRAIDERFMRARAETAFVVAAPRFLVEALGLILIALMAVAIAGRPGGFIAALPILGALALGAQRLLPLMNQLYSGWANLAASRPIIAEVASLARLPIDEDSGKQVDPVPFMNSIEMVAVSFRYADRAGPAVHDVSLTIPNGARVAVVGKTGSGKSTLADLLMGLIEPNEGQVKVDGQAITGGRQYGWRKSIAHVPQTIFLEDASIADNIARSWPTAEKDMARVRQAATTAQLADFVESLPDSYHTQVGERGIRLSGGQRQLLGLARAIYKDAPLMVLDEATSAIDEVTEAALFKALDALEAEGRTIIIIAHRHSTINGCDLHFRLDHGRLIETRGSDQLPSEWKPVRSS